MARLNRRRFLRNSVGIFVPTVFGIVKAQEIFQGPVMRTIASSAAFVPSDISGMIFGFEPRFGAYKSTSPNVQAGNLEKIVLMPDYWSGNGNDVSQGNTSNQPLYRTSQYGSYDGMSFGGGAVAMDFASDLLGTGAFSISFKIKFDSTASANRLIDNGKAMLFTTNTGLVSASRSGATVPTFDTLSTGTWYNLVITSSSASPSLINIYKDGVQFGTADQSGGNPTAGSSTFTLGNRAAGDRGFAGRLLYVCAWNKVLSSTELAQITGYLP